MKENNDNFIKLEEQSNIYNQPLLDEQKREISKLAHEAEMLAEEIEVSEIDLETIEIDEPTEPVTEIFIEPNKEEKVAEEKEVINSTETKNANGKKKRHIPQPVKYAMFAISAGVIQLIVSNILYACLKNTEWGMMNFIIEQEKAQFTANTVGLALSILWNFTFNRKYTFKSAGNIPRAMFLSFLFYVPFYPFQIWCEPTLQNAMAPGETWSYLISLLIVMLTNGVLEFCWQKFFIYRKEEGTAENAPKKEKKTK